MNVLRNNVLLTGAAASVVFVVSVDAAGDQQAASDVAIDAVNSAIQSGISTLHDDAPDWLGRTSIEVQMEKGFKPTYEVETVQPIHQHTESDMYFWQLNARNRDSNSSYNLGVGYRNIITPDWLLGVNSFYDYTTVNSHRRLGLGVEAISHHFEARLNSYSAISKRKQTGTSEFEEALDGWDVEVGGAILPFDRDLKIYLSHAEYDAKNTDDYKDNRLRVIYPITTNLELEAGFINEEDKYSSLSKDRGFATIKYTFGSGRSESGANVISLQEKLLQPVERRHEIVVEKTVNASVTVSRGN